MIEVNLHPTGRKRRRRRGRPAVPAWLKKRGEGRDPWQIAVMAVPAVVVLAIGWMWFSQRSARGELEELLSDAVADSARLADLRALSDSLLAREARVRERLELVQELDANRFVWPHLMDEISRALPDYLWLSSIRENSPLPDLRFQVDGLAANPLAITAFVRRLQASPYIGEVRILSSQQQFVEDVTTQAFKILVQYTAPPDSLVRRQPVMLGRS